MRRYDSCAMLGAAAVKPAQFFNWLQTQDVLPA
jgi:hypothetical protein